MRTIQDKLDRVARQITLFQTALKNGKSGLAEEHLDEAKILSSLVNSDIQHLRVRVGNK